LPALAAVLTTLGEHVDDLDDGGDTTVRRPTAKAAGRDTQPEESGTVERD